MKRRCQGFTLAEVLATLIPLGAVWATVALALHSMYEAEQRLSNGFENANAVDHLAQRLRSDAHEALVASVEESDNGPALMLVSSETQRVRYRSVAEGIERAALVGDTTEHREVFYMPSGAVGWRIAERNERQIVLLGIQLRDVRRSFAREHEIKAAVGLVPVASTDVEGEQP
ncbi:MAG: hypothetical protein CMJ64_29340 [Planctomycetaceae bacterium]|jgi:hypothetical protein|nr:hypothetical protein [Planctomycetaceae bacterium]